MSSKKEPRTKMILMRNNIGVPDKIIRLIIALALLVLVFEKIILSPIAVFFFILSIYLIITCFKGHCTFYKLFGLKTNKNLNEKARIDERNQALLKNYFKNIKEEKIGFPEKGLRNKLEEKR
jgi:hypothetical protein